MTLDWRPRETTSEEDARALAIALAAGTVVGATAFWLARTLLGRDRIRIEPPAAVDGSAARRLAADTTSNQRLERGDE